MWLMRQAGRYMAAFRQYSDRLGFRERSETASIAIELSLQPWQAFQTDGVIMFRRGGSRGRAVQGASWAVRPSAGAGCRFRRCCRGGGALPSRSAQAAASSTRPNPAPLPASPLPQRHPDAAARPGHRV